MMSKRLRVGVAAALLMAACHAMWAMLVAAGWAQPVIDFVFRIHFIQPPYTILAFSISTAVVLIAVVSAIGFVMGYVLALIWDRF